MMEQRAQAIAAINQAAEKQGRPEAQYTVGAQVWLEGKNLKLPYQLTKLVPTSANQTWTVESVAVLYR
jgi:hypothetical protein